MPIDSLIRLRQLNKQEVSGYAVEIIKQYLTTGTGVSVASTGSLTGAFYPLRANPSGYITGDQSMVVFSTQTGSFVDTTTLALTQNTIYSQVSGLFYQKSNPSGFITKTTGDLLYVQLGPTVNTGQLIFDDNVAVGYTIDFNPNKWFFMRGTGGAIIDFYNSTGARITGFSISSNDIKVSGLSVLNDPYQFINVRDSAPNTGLTLRDNIKSILPFEYKQYAGFGIRGIQGAMIDLYDSGRSYSRPYISGFDLVDNNIYINNTLFTGFDSFATYEQLITASGLLNDYIDALNEYTVNVSGYFESNLPPTGAIDWDNRWLIASGGQTILDWNSGVIYDRNGKTVMSWNSGARLLYNNSGIQNIDANTYQLYDTGIFISVDWSGRRLYDENEDLSLDWSGRNLAGTWTVNNSLILTKASGDLLYYSITNPSNFTTQSYVNTQIDNLALLKGLTQSNDSAYFYDSFTASYPLRYSEGTEFILSGNLFTGAIIDIYGSTHLNRPYISGFEITGAHNIWADNIYLGGVPIGQALTGLSSLTGNSLSKYDDRHNTRMVLWNTGSSYTGMFFSGGNEPFFIQFYYQHPNTALEYKNKIDIRNSTIDGYGFTNVQSYIQPQGSFGFYDTLNNRWAFLFDLESDTYYLQGPTGAFIDLARGVISGFDLGSVSGLSLNGIGAGAVTITGIGGTVVTTSGKTIYISGGGSSSFTGTVTGNFYPITGGQVSGDVLTQSLTVNKYGYGAGIRVFQKGIASGASANIFAIYNVYGTVAFDNFIGVSNSGYSVVKNYFVAGQSSGAPVFAMLTNTGPYGANDFTATYFNTGTTGVALRITNNASVSGDFFVTITLGGSSQPISVVEL
jgi:hypothetical protein